MKRVFNFSPGPSMLPLAVLEKAAAEMCDANGSGQSVMEMSHRSKDFKPIIEKAESLLRELMGIPANYKVLFLQGGASLQFSMIPLNLAVTGKKAVYIDTGIWAEKAAKEAGKFAEVDVRASSKDKAYSYIPQAPAAKPDDAYYHITLNNTIVGTKWAKIPDTVAATGGAVPLLTDFSSCALSEPLDVSKFALLYAGAQKNLGPAGVTVVIIREDLIGHAPSKTPAMLRYDIHADEGSMYNTPSCYGIYVIGLVLEWLKNLGGVPAIGKLNQEKAGLFYQYLDNSKLFYSPVEKSSRSLMNIPFIARVEDAEKRTELENRFVKEAAAAGMVNLAGHRLVGGMRASIYNAMPLEGVQTLIQFMEQFEKKGV
jgi:phosphoserine aminotransferase